MRSGCASFRGAPFGVNEHADVTDLLGGTVQTVPYLEVDNDLLCGCGYHNRIAHLDVVVSMTTGSFNYSIPSTLVAAPTVPDQRYWVKSWTGADRTKRRPPREWLQSQWHGTYVDRKGRVRNITRTVRVPLSWGTPSLAPYRGPKREYDKPNAYSMSTTYAKEVGCKVIYSDCPGYPPDTCKPAVWEGGVIPFYSNFGCADWSWENLATAADELNHLQRLRKKIEGSTFNAGVALAELPQATQMIFRSAAKIRKAMELTRARNYVNALRELLSGTGRTPQGRHRDGMFSRAPSAAWLEMQYGWLPLLSDVVDAAKMLAHQLNVPLRKKYIAVWRKEVLRERTIVRTFQGNCCPVDNATITCKTYASKTTFRRWTAYIEELNVPQLLGLADPLAIAWEKLPWSFVADWFIPVSDWLAARGLSQSLKGTFVFSYKHKGMRLPDVHGRAEIKLLGYPEPWVSVLSGRVIYSSLPVPKPVFTPLGEVLSWKRAANAVSLLVQQFAGRTDSPAVSRPPRRR